MTTDRHDVIDKLVAAYRRPLDEVPAEVFAIDFEFSLPPTDSE